MDCKDLLMRLSTAVGVSGREHSVVALAAQELQPFGEVTISPLGDLICTIRRPEPGQKHFLLDAHVDEIGMIVNWIDDEGFLKVAPVGGFDRSLLLASQVAVHTAQGDLPGFICSIPPHLQSGEAKNPKFEEIYIDIGYGKEEAEKRVRPGDIVTFVTPTREMHGGFITSKAIDNRSSCAAVMRAAELLQGEQLPCGLSVTLTSREEIGGMGARTAAYTVNPTHAVTVDVGFGWTPDCKKEQCGEFGKGPIVAFGSLLDSAMSRTLTEAAKENEIPYQVEAMGGGTGTNADNILIARGGVKTGILSIPQGYMHTPVEKILVADIENTARLLAAYVKKEGNRK
ncbi:MAG: M20/M25/M40 family metallo-hydrolase [Oscillospiraceae bacterium]|nr:M20/M25/M40 family metallo-hydrolase [Oscillospiraceae bacterium]